MHRPLSIAAIASLASSVCAGFGSTWWIEGYPAQTQTYILSAKTTLEVPPVPSPQVDRLALWPGMETTDGTSDTGLVQSIIVSFGDPSSAVPNGCGGAPGQWCAFAGTYLPVGPDGTMQEGPYVPVNPGDMLDIEYTFDPGSGVASQTVTLAGQVLSTLETSTGFPYYFDIAVECQADASGMTPEHYYHSTQIVLSQADMNWPNTLYKSDSSDSGISTPDGGQTWVVDTVTVDSANCTP